MEGVMGDIFGVIFWIVMLIIMFSVVSVSGGLVLFILLGTVVFELSFGL